MSDITTLNAG